MDTVLELSERHKELSRLVAKLSEDVQGVSSDMFSVMKALFNEQENINQLAAALDSLTQRVAKLENELKTN